MFLTHFWPTFRFYTPSKHRKTNSVLVLSGSIKKTPKNRQKQVKKIIPIIILFLMPCMLPLRFRIASANFLEIFMIKLLKSLRVYKKFLISATVSLHKLTFFRSLLSQIWDFFNLLNFLLLKVLTLKYAFLYIFRMRHIIN